MGGHLQRRDTAVWGWGSPRGGTRLWMAKSLVEGSGESTVLMMNIPVTGSFVIVLRRAMEILMMNIPVNNFQGDKTGRVAFDCSTFY